MCIHSTHSRTKESLPLPQGNREVLCLLNESCRNARLCQAVPPTCIKQELSITRHNAALLLCAEQEVPVAVAHVLPPGRSALSTGQPGHPCKGTKRLGMQGQTPEGFMR